MSKVGIMSMQKIKNYGSFLQAYALKRMIEKLGHNVEFVDYHVEKTLISDEKKSNAISKVLETLKNDGKLIHKIQYIKHKKEFSKNNFKTLGIFDEENYNPKLDILVIGSDEVFNCIQKNKNVGYSLDLFGKNNNAKKVISYAASFGNTTLTKIEKFGKEKELSELLKKFESISVRDENSAKIIKELINKEPYYNLDPVLIYDYMNECNEIPEITTKEKYMILYAYSGRISKEEAKIIKEYCEKQGVKIYSIGGVQPYADKFIDCSPFEVLAYFKNAEFVITDTFHGSIFSIINNKKFATIVRKSIGNEYGNEEKLMDLLTRLELKNRAISNIKDIIEILNKDIDYTNTIKIIEKERLNTIEYLLRQIGKNKGINVNETNCCGCGACVNICPQNAIKLIENTEGFKYPVIDNEKCTNCGMCEKVCNYRNDKEKFNKNIKSFAALNIDKEMLKKSASGGVFSAIAYNFIKNNGVVYGSSLYKDDLGFKVEHIRIDNCQEIYKIQGSKYVQSDTKKTYKSVLEDLKNGKIVLYTGTPCQIHGLYGYLQNKKYNNLYTMDIICHGVPSIKMFNDYINMLEKKYNKKISFIKFRDKSQKSGYNLRIDFVDGTKKITKAYNSSYFQLFLDSKIDRKNCYTCTYAKKERVADVTIGDFWGIEKEYPELLDDKFNSDMGISCVLVNTDQGESLLENYGNMLQTKETKISKIAKYNRQLNKATSYSEDRNIILRIYKNSGYSDVDKYYKKKNFLKNFIKLIIKR